MNEIIKSAINRVKLKGENIWTRYSYWTKAKDVELENGETVEDKILDINTNLLNHVANKSNPHNVTKVQLELENVDNTKDEDKIVSTLQREAIDMSYQQSTGYTDKKIADLIGSAPTTLDTLEEIAKAMQENDDVVTALHESIGSKAAQAELDGHINNSTIHITATEREKWNAQSDYSEIIGNTDISSIENGTLTGAISSLNDNKANNGHTHAISNVNGLQSALDNKVTTGTSAKLNTLALADSKIALVYSEDDNVNFRYKNASGNTSYLNLRNIESKFDTLTNTLTSRGGYSWLAGMYDGTDGVTKSVVCTTIGNYRYLMFVLQYEDVRIDVKTIPRAFFVNEVTKQAYALLLKSGNSEAAALVWWDSNSNSIFSFINSANNVVNVYGIV